MCYVILQHFFVLMVSGAAYAAALYEMTSIHCALQHRGKRVYVSNTPPAYCCLDICASVNPNIFRADYSDVCIFNVALAMRKARSIMALVQRRDAPKTNGCSLLISPVGNLSSLALSAICLLDVLHVRVKNCLLLSPQG